MTDCGCPGERLTAYVDGSVSAAEKASIERHLAACAPCRASAEVEQAGRELLQARAAQLRETPLPPGLRTRCEALIRERTTVAPPLSWRSRLVQAGLMAALVIAVGAAVLLLGANRSEALLAAQINADHDRCFRIYVPPDAPALDAEAVEAELASRYGWNIHVPPSSEAAGLTLVYARRCLFGRAPHLMYKATDGEDVSLYVLEGEALGDRDTTAFGHHTQTWTRGETTYVLVTAAAAGDLGAAEDYLRQQLQ